MKHSASKFRSDTKGFGIVGILAIIVVVAAAGLGGWAVYHHNHDTKKATTTATKMTSKATKAKDSSQATADPYVGWKTYTDTTNGYSFRYPAGWTVDGTTNLPGTRLLSSTGTTVVEYVTNEPKSISTETFTATSITRVNSASEDLDIVGGYIHNTTAGRYFPSYQVVDSSVIADYPLIVGKVSPFPAVPSFILKGTSVLGSLASAPTDAITSLGDVQTWLGSVDAKTSLLILKSLTYKQ